MATEVLALGPDPATAAIVVVAVHGRNQEPSYMVEHVVERVLERSERDDIAWLLPSAADHSWYPGGFLAPLAENQPDLDHALAALAAIEQRLAARDPATVVWCGFSQGACMVSEHVARGGRRWGGLLAYTGARIGPPGTDHTIHADLSGMPAYFGVGDADDWVPVEPVRQTAEAYRAAGADVTVEVFPGRPHEICDAEIDAATRLLATLRS